MSNDITTTQLFCIIQIIISNRVAKVTKSIRPTKGNVNIIRPTKGNVNMHGQEASLLMIISSHTCFLVFASFKS